MGYIQIYITEKGFAHITLTTREKIEAIINDEEEFSGEDLAKLDRKGEIDCEYSSGKYIFIKGEILELKAVEKVTKYEIK